MIRDLGYQVVEAEGPAQAVEIAEQSAEIDLVLTDMVMPDMGGPELVKVIQKTHSGIKVIFMSGYLNLDLAPGRPGTRSEINYLQKPFDATLLATALRNALDRP